MADYAALIRPTGFPIGMISLLIIGKTNHRNPKQEARPRHRARLGSHRERGRAGRRYLDNRRPDQVMPHRGGRSAATVLLLVSGQHGEAFPTWRGRQAPMHCGWVVPTRSVPETPMSCGSSQTALSLIHAKFGLSERLLNKGLTNGQ